MKNKIVILKTIFIFFFVLGLVFGSKVYPNAVEQQICHRQYSNQGYDQVLKKRYCGDCLLHRARIWQASSKCPIE